MFRYLPKPEKSFAIYPIASEERVLTAFGSEGLDVKACRGHWYVGGYMGSLKMRNRWVGPKVDSWVAAVKTISMIASKYPQLAYHGFTLLIQAEWQYCCRFIPGVGTPLAPVDQAIQTHLISALIEVPQSAVTDSLRTLLSHGVKAGGLDLRNPEIGADRLFQASEEVLEVLVTSLMVNTDLDFVQHRACVHKAGTDARKEKVRKDKEKLKLMSEGASKRVKKRLDRIGECGIWISMMPHKLHGTILSRDDFNDNI